MAAASVLGVWRDGPLADMVPGNTSVQLSWPAATDGDIELVLVDQDGHPVDLAIDSPGTDKAELSIYSSLGGEALRVWTAAKLTDGVGRYKFTLTAGETADFGGFLIFAIHATRDGKRRQVVGSSYFHATP